MEMDFGTISSSRVVSWEFDIKNDGEGPVNIVYARASCSCLSAMLDRDSMAPGETAKLTAKLDPKGYRGGIYRSIEIGFRSQSGQESSVSLSMRAFVADPILPSQASIKFKGIDLNPKGKLAAHKSGAITLEPAQTLNGVFSPIALVSPEYGQSIVTNIEKKDGRYVLDVYFSPRCCWPKDISGLGAQR